MKYGIGLNVDNMIDLKCDSMILTGSMILSMFLDHSLTAITRSLIIISLGEIKAVVLV